MPLGDADLRGVLPIHDRRHLSVRTLTPPLPVADPLPRVPRLSTRYAGTRAREKIDKSLKGL